MTPGRCSHCYRDVLQTWLVESDWRVVVHSLHQRALGVAIDPDDRGADAEAPGGAAVIDPVAQHRASCRLGDRCPLGSLSVDANTQRRHLGLPPPPDPDPLTVLTFEDRVTSEELPRLRFAYEQGYEAGRHASSRVLAMLTGAATGVVVTLIVAALVGR